MVNLSIRKETSGDYTQVDGINQAAFPGDGEMHLVQALRAGGELVLSMVAVLENRVVGHIAFSRGFIENGEKRIPSVGLGPMAVPPDHQGKGIGTELVRQSLTHLRSMDEPHCFVLGHTWFYPKFGFLPASGFNIDSVYQAREHFMGLELTPDSLQKIAGRFVYSAAFDGV